MTGLRKVRVEKKISINKLSSITNINASYISKLERGVNCNPSITIVNKLAKALNVDIKELFL